VGEGLSPDGMFEAYAGFTIQKQAEAEKPIIREQPLDASAHEINAD